MSGTVSKHVGVVGELSKLVQAYNLMQLSECEQELICGSDHNDIVQVSQILHLYSIHYSL